MNCRNHEGVPAEDRCAGCAEGFCSHCLVQVAGRKHCSACKIMVVKAPPQVTDGNMPCEEAGKALGYSVVGVLCFAGFLGIIFAVMAVTKALEARKLIQEDPRLTGEAKANVALILGGMTCLLWIIAMIGQAKSRL